MTFKVIISKNLNFGSIMYPHAKTVWFKFTILGSNDGIRLKLYGDCKGKFINDKSLITSDQIFEAIRQMLMFQVIDETLEDRAISVTDLRINGILY